MQYSKMLIEAIRMAIKASNQRIVQLDTTFGSDSAVTKNTLSFLQKGAFNKYVTKSNLQNVLTPTGASGVSHTKFDSSKFIKDLKSGAISEDDANAILIQLTGKRISKDGELQKVGTGVKTVTDIEKSHFTKEDLRSMSKKEIREELEEREKISQDFQTEYEAMADVSTLAERKQFFKELFGSGKKSYSDIEKMTADMKNKVGKRKDLSSMNEKDKRVYLRNKYRTYITKMKKDGKKVNNKLKNE